jgi:hypothetical protein
MNTSEQRKQWAAHIADEAEVLQGQQQSAGESHAPLESPIPHTVEELEAAVTAAVAAERQRCAEIADRWTDEPRLLATFGDFTEWELRAASATARAVASEIRAAAAR